MHKLSIQTTAQLASVYNTVQYSLAILPASNCAAGMLELSVPTDTHQ